MITLEDMPILAQTTGTRTYEEICEDSRIAVQTSDDAGWHIGDNAIEITQRYGNHTLADYAREIGKPKSTVYEAASMSNYWTTQVRTELAEECPNVTRSHMRKVLFMHDPDKARWAVEKCSERGWTVDQFGYILKRYKSLKGIKGKPDTPQTVRVTFEAAGWNAGIANIGVFLNTDDLEPFRNAVSHDGVTVEVTVTYATPRRP